MTFAVWRSSAPTCRRQLWRTRACGHRQKQRALGAGILIVLPESSCGLAETARVVRYLSEETAGQCGPCVNGLHAIATALEQVARGNHDRSTLAQLDRWCTQVDGRGACRYPDGAVRFVRSALDVFADEILEHTAQRRCHAQHDHPLSLPDPRTRDWDWK